MGDRVTKKRRLESKLDIRKRKAALLLVENEMNEYDTRKTQDDLAAEVGITRKCLWQWKTQDRDFIEYVNILADDFLDAKRTVVYRQMMKLIEGSQPSVKAMQLYLQRQGLLTDKKVVEYSSEGSNKSNDDIKKELEELDELLGAEGTE